MDPGFISVIGGLGGMGGLMVRLLNQAGYRVRIADIRAGSIDWAEIAVSQVIFLAVPLTAVQQVMTELGPLTRTDGVIIDLCSLKEAPLQTMLEHARGEIIGSHPLFGPSVTSIANQVVYVCAARGHRWLPWFCEFITGLGARVVEINPAEHDQLMARIQVLRHMLLFTFGLSLARLDFEAARLLPLAGPWFAQLVDMLQAQLRQSPDLYADLAMANPESKPVWNEFLKAAGEFSLSIAQGDRPAMLNLINQVASYWSAQGLDPDAQQAGPPGPVAKATVI